MNANEFLTPVGRLVSGDCFKGKTTDAEGNPLMIKSGPNAGKARTDYYFAIAIPKTDPGYEELKGKIYGEAKASFPNLFDAAGNCTNPNFAFKIIDGDSITPNSKGIKPCDREGYKGNWVLSFSGSFAPRCYSKGGESVLTDPESIKRGYFIRVYGSVRGNGATQQPGVFLNHSMIELIGYGEEIKTGPDANAVFGAKPVATLPPGATAAPVAPAQPIATPQTASAVPGPVVAPAGVTPAPDFLNNAPVPAAPVVPEVFNVQGVKYTREQLKAAGWIDEQINGLPK